MSKMKPYFHPMFDVTAPDFWASSVAMERSDAMLILDPLNLDLF